MSRRRGVGRRILTAALLAAALSAAAPLVPAAAQVAPYAQRTAYLLAPPGSAPAGMLGYVNPAVLAGVEQPESVFAWSTRRRWTGGVDDWGVFCAVPHVGLGVVRHGEGRAARSDYVLGLGAGGGDLDAGLGWGWSSGRGPDPEAVWIAGALARPSPRLSAGATVSATPDAGALELAGDLGLRPFGTPRLTLFAEAARARGAATWWSAGADLGLGDGLHLAGRYLDGGTVSLGLRLELGPAGLWSQARRDDGRTRGHHAVRLGPDRGSALAPLERRRPAYLRLDLHGPVRHRAFPLFDDGHPLLRLLHDLQRVEDDPGLAGVALNLSGLQIDAAMAWELRQRLLALRAAGRTVVVYVDRADLRLYHLASAADRIVLDPVGLVGLEGFAAGQLYLRGALDKLGIGSQEWRYREYKSAFEPLTRRDMSAADREQWQAVVDDAYGRARADICAARGLAPEAFDALVDSVTVLLPAEALARGLVDTVGRWDLVESLIVTLGGRGGLVEANRLRPRADEDWGPPPTVAVVYALGVCAMDSGIRARDLARELRDLAEDDGIHAVVLRVDSPGGDVLASDLVADALKACRAEKPVVVSQAALAASGGYWISLESDAIVATPATLTGSIGVIGGWLYDQGLKAKLGLSTDHVQAGAHADLGLGVPLPLLGYPLPDRALTEDEVARTEHVMGSLYDDFVGRVAGARGQSREQIDAVARGRVWSGAAARQRGLVDTLGGLDTALGVARDRAGLDPRRPLRVVERPRLGLWSLQKVPRWLAVVVAPRRRPDAAAGQPLWLQWLHLRLDHNGAPLVLLPEPYFERAADPRPQR